jgi:hypothetical protein
VYTFKVFVIAGKDLESRKLTAGRYPKTQPICRNCFLVRARGPSRVEPIPFAGNQAKLSSKPQVLN